MALSNELLQEIISNLTPEERIQLQSQLDLQITQDQNDIAEGREPLSPINRPTAPTAPKAPTTPKIPKQSTNDIYCCLFVCCC